MKDDQTIFSLLTDHFISVTINNQTFVKTFEEEEKCQCK